MSWLHSRAAPVYHCPIEPLQHTRLHYVKASLHSNRNFCMKLKIQQTSHIILQDYKTANIRRNYFMYNLTSKMTRSLPHQFLVFIRGSVRHVSMDVNKPSREFEKEASHYCTNSTIDDRTTGHLKKVVTFLAIGFCCPLQSIASYSETFVCLHQKGGSVCIEPRHCSEMN